MTEMPNMITGSNAPSAELYAMECTLEVEMREVLGGAETLKTCKWSGYASLDVINSMLDMMAKMVVEK